MFQYSCSQRPALGGKTLSSTSHLTSTGMHQHLIKAGRGPSLGSFSHGYCFGIPSLSSASQHQLKRRNFLVASLKPASGKGFGKKNVVGKKTGSGSSEVISSSESPSQEDVPASFQYRREEVEEDEEVPEVVTNRMLKRIGITVGVPLGFGLLLFPLFYYLKIVSKVDVPEWLPLVISMVTFGTAGFGITYGIVSSSWDPAREGSLLGWKEAQVNWPLIWDKVQGNPKK